MHGYKARRTIFDASSMNDKTINVDGYLIKKVDLHVHVFENRTTKLITIWSVAIWLQNEMKKPANMGRSFQSKLQTRKSGTL